MLAVIEAVQAPLVEHPVLYFLSYAAAFVLTLACWAACMWEEEEEQ